MSHHVTQSFDWKYAGRCAVFCMDKEAPDALLTKQEKQEKQEKQDIGANR